jgi:hypothetical protein
MGSLIEINDTLQLMKIIDVYDPDYQKVFTTQTK